MLEGEASFGEDLCRRESEIQIFTNWKVGPVQESLWEDRKRKDGHYEEYKSHVDEILFPDGKPSRAGTITPATWAPIRKAINALCRS